MGEVEQPVRARLLLVRHADAAGVDDPDAPDGALELGVRVAAHDRRHVEPLEERGDPFLGRALGEDVHVVARRGVAVEDVADALRRRQAVEELDLLPAQLGARLLQEVGRRETLLARMQLAVGVAAQPHDAVAEAAEPRERLRRLLAAGADVAAHHDGRVVGHLREHGFERGEVAVDVVESGDGRHVSRRSRAGAGVPPRPRPRARWCAGRGRAGRRNDRGSPGSRGRLRRRQR